MLTLFAKLLKALNSEQSPGQLAAGVSFAIILGLTPLLSLHNILVLLIVLFFRVNLSVFLVMWPLFSIIGLMLAPVSESLGLALLQHPTFLPVWESFYNTLIGRWSNFYFSGVIGGLVIATALAIISYPISKLLINQYRSKLLSKFEQYKVIKMLKASKFYQLYDSYSN